MLFCENLVQNKAIAIKTNQLETEINATKALRASTDSYGMTKVTNASDITDSTGIALAGTEKNASISGTLANQISTLNNNLNDATNKLNVVGGVSVTTVTLLLSFKAS